MTLFRPERDLSTISSRIDGSASVTAAATRASATRESTARRPQATAAATTMPTASATKLDWENEISSPSHVAAVTAYSPASRQPRTPPSTIPASVARIATAR